MCEFVLFCCCAELFSLSLRRVVGRRRPSSPPFSSHPSGPSRSQQPELSLRLLLAGSRPAAAAQSQSRRGGTSLAWSLVCGRSTKSARREEKAKNGCGAAAAQHQARRRRLASCNLPPRCLLPFTGKLLLAVIVRSFLPSAHRAS